MHPSSSSPQWLCHDMSTMHGQWWSSRIVSFRTNKALRYMYYNLCFVHVEHSLCHEPISVLINIIMLLA